MQALSSKGRTSQGRPLHAERTCRVSRPAPSHRRSAEVSTTPARCPPSPCRPPTHACHAAMFEHFGVNSLSSFKSKFYRYRLQPGATPAVQAALPSLPAPGGGCRRRWHQQQHEAETYVGELLDGQRHGLGLLLTQVGAPTIHTSPAAWVEAAAVPCQCFKLQLRPTCCCRHRCRRRCRASAPLCCTWGASWRGGVTARGWW